jgi:hypothetical protein
MRQHLRRSMSFDEIVPPAFTREVATGFYLDSDDPPPIPGQFGNDQPLDVLDGIAEANCEQAVALIRAVFPSIVGGDCSVPKSYAPVEPFIDDADGDGIKTADEPPIDRDGDGLIAPIDPDDNGNEAPDGTDPDLPQGIGSPTSCGDRSGLDFGAWPMRGYCPSRRGSSNLLGPRQGLLLWEFSTWPEVRPTRRVSYVAGLTVQRTASTCSILVSGAQAWAT